MLVVLLAGLIALHGAHAPRRSDYQPEWSPDGTRLAFVRMNGEGGGSDIWIANRSGRGARNLTPHVDGTYYDEEAWSPDGASLAFQADYGSAGSSGIEVIHTDGTGAVVLPSPPSDIAMPSWSPDGRQLALIGDFGLYLAPVGGWQAVVATDAGLTVPSWSPDSTHIVIEGLTSLELYDVASRQATPFPAPPSLASWSPDGTRIAFTWGCGVGVLPATATGKPAPYRTCNGFNRSVPSWSPGSTRITFSRCVAVLHCTVYVASAAAPGRAVAIARGRNPVWSPDGRRIAYERWVDDHLYGIWLIDPNGAGARPFLP
jgi:Tol biopolymer transport system component